MAEVGSIHDSLRCWNSLPLLVQLPEYGCQAALTAMLLLTGHWLYGGMHAVLLAYHARQVRAHRLQLGCVLPCLRRPAAACVSNALLCHSCCLTTAHRHPTPHPPNKQFLQGRHLADVTEIFRQVGPRKRHEMVKLGFYLLTFVLAIYK